MPTFHCGECYEQFDSAEELHEHVVQTHGQQAPPKNDEEADGGKEAEKLTTVIY